MHINRDAGDRAEHEPKAAGADRSRLEDQRRREVRIRIISRFDWSTFDEAVDLLGVQRIQGALANLAEMVGELVRPLERQDLGRAAHKTITVAGLLGFSGLAQDCRTLETECKSGDDLNDTLDALRDSYDPILQDIAQLIQSLVSTQGSAR